MVTLVIPARARDVATDPETRIPEVAPFFYWVPSPGVRCYTYDYRPALKKRMSNWDKVVEQLGGDK